MLHDQIRFIPGIQGCVHIKKYMNVTYYTNKEKNHMFILIDAKDI